MHPILKIMQDSSPAFISNTSYPSSSPRFVTPNIALGNNGSTPSEMFLVSAIVPGVSLTLSLFQSIGLLHALVCQFIVLMSVTVWNNYLLEIVIFICGIAFLTIFFKFFGLNDSVKRDNEKGQKNRQNILDLQLTYQGQIPFLTDYRGHVLLLTAISILAVDFAIYPRRFAKTTYYGWSLMDIGVGSFVFIHAICSSQARGNHQTNIKKSFMSSVPLLLLGFMRIIALSIVRYHQSISEYGVHWNFFFTLGITKIASSFLLKLPYFNNGIMALCILIGHQWLLSCCGVTDIIFSKQRDSFFMENKEGICSLPGYISIYLAGVELGKFLWIPRCKLKDWICLFGFLLAIGFTGLIIMFILHYNLQPTSRRMANMSYCVYVISISSIHISQHLLEHLILASVHYRQYFNNGSIVKSNQSVTQHSCLLWKSINYNGLFYFLFSNILTGIVNITIDIDSSSTFQSLCILLAYISTLLLTAKVLMNFSVQLKFW